MQQRVTALSAATVASCHMPLDWWHRRSAAPELIQWAWFAHGSMACTATVVACSSCHGSSARCPLIKWRLPNIESITLRIYESFGPMVGWQIHACKHALCMPSLHTAAVCSRVMRLALCVSPGRPFQMLWKPRRRLSDDLSSRACLLGLSMAPESLLRMLSAHCQHATG